MGWPLKTERAMGQMKIMRHLKFEEESVNGKILTPCFAFLNRSMRVIDAFPLVRRKRGRVLVRSGLQNASHSFIVH